MDRLAARLIAVLAMIMFATLAPNAGATVPGKNGKIAFASDRSGAFEIFTMNADSSAQAPLLHDGIPLRGVQPAWSPDGQRIAFKTEAASIAVVDADGTNLRVLGGVGVSDWPTWSPDGSKLAFNGNGFFDIYTMNTDGSGKSFVARGLTPDWSPDGSAIAFGQRGGGGIYTVKPDGTGLKQLTQGIDDSPSWSPDGKKVSFERAAGGYDVMTIGTDGTGLTNVTHSPIDEVDPSWSPDGKRIAFSGNASATDVFHEVFAANIDGSGRTRLTNLSPASDILPDWQSIPVLGPKRSDYRNAAKFCKAERAFLGKRAFRQKYGTGPKRGANAYAKCVSRNH